MSTRRMVIGIVVVLVIVLSVWFIWYITYSMPADQVIQLF